MTPAARVAAAIDILDDIIAGQPAERALTAWARRSRFAGSKDRAAIRDHVFDVLRARRSLGDGNGRALMIALALRDGLDLDALFSGDGHAPAPVTPAERVLPVTAGAAACDIPDWLWPAWQDSLGDQAEAAATAQQLRAPVFLRVNRRRATRADAMELMQDDGIAAENHPEVASALQITGNARKLKSARAYLDGVVELQDAASQLAVASLQVPAGARVLDYCAGGGGKALALADLHDCTVTAHDIAPARMQDLPARAARAGVAITCQPTDALADKPPFDLVFCDAPCSGSGTWRRTPDAKWRLGEDDLTRYNDQQMQALSAAAGHVAQGGQLVYATCSVLRAENADIVARFLAAHPEWRKIQDRQLVPSALWDGFYVAYLVRQ